MAFIDTADKEFPIYDVLNFSYKWEPKTFKQTKGVGGWICTDGYANINTSNQADIINGIFPEKDQDCVVDNGKSLVTIDDTNFGTFKVHFLRKLETRGGKPNDATLKIGEKV